MGGSPGDLELWAVKSRGGMTGLEHFKPAIRKLTSVRGQRVRVLGFAGHIFCATTTQRHCRSVKADLRDKHVGVAEFQESLSVFSELGMPRNFHVSQMIILKFFPLVQKSRD